MKTVCLLSLPDCNNHYIPFCVTIGRTQAEALYRKLKKKYGENFQSRGYTLYLHTYRIENLPSLME